MEELSTNFPEPSQDFPLSAKKGSLLGSGTTPAIIAPSWFKRDWLWGALLVLAVFLAYQPVWYAGYIWDDDANVTQNLPLRSWHGLWRIWFEPGTTQQYYPLTYTNFWIEYQLWQANPLGYHLENVFLHAGNAILLWMILRKLDVKGAWLAASLFALHPVCVESVAWVSECKNTLSGFFYLGSLYAALEFWKLGTRAPDANLQQENKQWGFFWLALALYLAALCSKTATAPLPVVILLLLWWKRPKFELRDLYPLAPFFILGFALGLMTIWVEKHFVGTTGTAWNFSWPDRIIVVGKQMAFYFGKLIWPYPLMAIYPRWEIIAAQPLMYLPFLVVVGGMIFLWRNRNTWSRPLFLAAAYFLILHLPSSGLFNQYYFIYSFVSDHFQYLACMGPLALAGAAMAWCANFVFEGKLWLHRTLCAGLLLILGITSWQRCSVYQNEMTLWTDTLSKNPNCWVGYNNLGNALIESGRIPEAIHQFQQALQIKPDYAEAHCNLGDALLRTGRISEAIDQLQQALHLNPDFAEAYYNLGDAMLQAGRLSDAINQFEQAVRLDPNNFNAHNNLGGALYLSGQAPEAIDQYKQALQIEPDYAEAHNNLGNALRKIGQLPEAMDQYEQALQINPDYAEAHFNLGDVLFQTGQVPKAIDEYKQALRINPNNVNAQNNLAKAETLLKNGSVKN